MRKVFSIILKMLKLKGEKKQYISMIIALTMIVAIATAGGLVYKNTILNNKIALDKKYGKYGTYILGEDYESNLHIKNVIENLNINYKVLIYDSNISWDKHPNDSKVFYVYEDTYKELTGFEPYEYSIALAGKDLEKEKYKNQLVVLNGKENKKYTIQATIDILPQIEKYMLFIPVSKEEIYEKLPRLFLVDLNNSLQQYKKLRKQLDEVAFNKYTMKSSIATYNLQRNDLNKLEVTLFLVVTMICLFTTVLLYIITKQLLLEQFQLWFTLQTMGLSKREVSLVMILKIIISVFFGIVIGGILGEYLGVLACRLTDTDIISLTTDFRYLLVSGIAITILFLLLIRWFRNNLIKNEIIKLINKEKNYTDKQKEKGKFIGSRFLILILVSIFAIINLFINTNIRVYFLSLAVILLLVFIIKSPNKYIGFFSNRLKLQDNKTLQIIGLLIDNHKEKIGFMISTLILSIVLFISSTTIVNTLKESANRMVDNVISYDYAVITTKEDFTLEQGNKDEFELIGKQLVINGMANDSLNIKFVVTDMDDFKKIYKNASKLGVIKDNQIVASNFLMTVLDKPISVKIEGLKEVFNIDSSIELIDHNAQCVYFIKSIDDFKRKYSNINQYSYYYFYKSKNSRELPKGDNYKVVSINQIKKQWSDITSQGMLPFEYFVIIVLILINVVFILHIRNMLLSNDNDFALFTVMGMKKRDIRKLIILETIITFAIAVIIAVIISIPFTIITIMLLSKISNIQLFISFNFKIIGLYILSNIFVLSTFVGYKISNENYVDISKRREVL